MTCPNFLTTKTVNIDELLSIPTIWVHTPSGLSDLIADIKTTDVVALDTEFIKRTTYYPILALIQVNTGKAIYLVDAPCLNLTEFWQALVCVPTMVWYACGEDLGIFYLLAKNAPLTNVFDVQIAVAYLTGKLQMGYSQAVHDVLDVTLDKGESQSDWLKRPLSSNQETYAVNDVRYLLALYDVIKDNLHQKNLYSYVAEDCLLYAKELHTSQNISDDELYLEFVAPMYNRQQLSVLKHLVAWRESLARTSNEPRSFIIGKQALREIILLMPETLKSLASTTINRHALRRYGDEIIKIIKRAKSLPQTQLPALPAPTYTSKSKLFKKAIDMAVSQYSQATHIPNNLLLRGRWVNDLLYLVHKDLSLDALPDGLKGYRHAWVVNTLLPLLKSYKSEIDKGFACS